MTNEGFKLIVRQYESLIFSICFQFTRDYHEAENLTQETFLSAFNNIDRCSPDKYKPWLCRIATNKAKDFLKSSYKRKVNFFEEGEESALKGGIQPEKYFLQQEGIDKIKKGIEGLKEPYKLVSMMYFLEDKTYEEIGISLNRPPKTVQTQILRAKKILREKLEGG